ncbi:MAG: hypothetical protein IT439_08275 [Phycisphaerales bacterium]|nr:hypothetical protein [Phycisphaerales bacterium]
MTLALAGAPYWLVVALLAALSAGSTAGAAWLAWRRALEAHPHEHAFRSIARRSGLSRHEREHVRSLASGAGVPPVALVLSPSALVQAIRSGPDSALSTRLSARAAQWANAFDQP